MTLFNHFVGGNIKSRDLSCINKTKDKIKGQKNWVCSCNEQLEIIPAFAVFDKGKGTGTCDGNIFLSFIVVTLLDTSALRPRRSLQQTELKL
jgi:hypothetical protein